MNMHLNSVSEPSFLRLALIADAAVSGFTGLAMMLGAGIVDSLLGLPATLLHYAGLSPPPVCRIGRLHRHPGAAVATSRMGRHRLQRAVGRRQHFADRRRMADADAARLCLHGRPGDRRRGLRRAAICRYAQVAHGARVTSCQRSGAERQAPLRAFRRLLRVGATLTLQNTPAAANAMAK